MKNNVIKKIDDLSIYAGLETCKLAKTFGYNVYSDYYYSNKRQLNMRSLDSKNSNLEEENFCVIDIVSLQRYLENKFKVDFIINRKSNYGEVDYTCRVYIDNVGSFIESDSFKDKFEAINFAMYEFMLANLK